MRRTVSVALRPVVRLSQSQYSSWSFWPSSSSSSSSSPTSHRRGTKTGSDFPVVKGTVSPPCVVPPHINRPPYAESGIAPRSHPPAQIHDEDALSKLRAANKLASDALVFAGSLVKPGVTTDAIDAAVHQLIVDGGAYPSPRNYSGFPKSICTSVNEVVCHGIPDDRPLVDGDILSIDVSCFLDGYHGDNCRTFVVGGKTDAAGEELVAFAEECLTQAISVVGPGVPIKSIGAEIAAMCSAQGYGSVREFQGHGIGTVFHTQPTVVHTINNIPGTLAAGMAFTIEPMITEGSARVEIWKDGWTAVTRDRGRAAQFEHALFVHDDGVEILTAYDEDGSPSPTPDSAVSATA